KGYLTSFLLRRATSVGRNRLFFWRNSSKPRSRRSQSAGEFEPFPLKTVSGPIKSSRVAVFGVRELLEMDVKRAYRIDHPNASVFPCSPPCCLTASPMPVIRENVISCLHHRVARKPA